MTHGRTIGVAVWAVLLATATLSAADWAQYQSDAFRSGYTAEVLSPELSLLWSRQARHEPQPAWVGREFARSRMQFDWAYSVVGADGLVYFGSSADHKVYALDAATGAERWSAFTGGPVRLAPAIWQDRLFCVSDDGYLHCFDRRTGERKWRLRSGPSGEQLIGNSRMISRWAARGGVAVHDGIVYFGAGNWPEEDVYIYAVDAASGKVLWRNDNTGALEIDQPHMVCFSRGGVIAQGYLAVAGPRVFVATGRSTPAVFRRTDGSFLHYHLARYGAKTPWGMGGGDIVATEELYYNSGLLFDGETGLRYSERGINAKWWKPHITPDKRRAHGQFYWRGRQGIAVTPASIVRYEGNSLRRSTITHRTFEAVHDVPTSYKAPRLKFLGMKDGKHKREQIDNAPRFRDQWSVPVPSQPLSLIVAGDKAVLGFDAAVRMVDLKTRKQVWEAPTDAPARSLALVDGRLYVATEKGTIQCYAAGGGQPARQVAARIDRLAFADSAGASRRVAGLLAQTTARKGYCLVLNPGEGGMIHELTHQSEFHVVALASDEAKAEQLRRRLDDAGVYGSRCVVLEATLKDMPDYFANLVVLGRAAGAPPAAELERVVRPYGGVVCAVAESGGVKLVSRRGALPGAGEWTHNFGTAGNTLYSGDTVVKGPLGMLWYEDETQRTIDRHGKNPAPLAYQGLLLREGVHSIRCRDAYNGAILYEIDLPNVLADYMEGTQVGGAHIGSTYCVADGVLYVRVGGECRTYDVFTGKPRATFQAPAMPDGTSGKWGYLACHDGVLVGGLMNETYVIRANHGMGGPNYQKPMDDHLTETKLLFALDAKTGKHLWSFKPEKSIRNNTIALAGGRVFLIDRETAQIDKLLRTEVARRRGAKEPLPQHAPGKLVALDARSGRVLWEDNDKVTGTLLIADEAEDVLLMSFYHVGFLRPSETPTGMRLYRASTGEHLWDRPFVSSRPVIAGDTIYSFPRAFDLATGNARTVTKPAPDAPVGAVWKIAGKGQGCGTVAASANLLLTRSATLGYYDLTQDRKWLENYGGFRAGCFLNHLPALGLVLVPDDTLACRCSYQNQATIALKEYGVRPPVVEPALGQKNFVFFPRSREPFFTGKLKVRMWHPRDDLAIRYTTDDTPPTATSTRYTDPIEISATTTFRAAVFAGDKRVEVKDAVIFRKVDNLRAILKQGMKR